MKQLRLAAERAIAEYEKTRAQDEAGPPSEEREFDWRYCAWRMAKELREALAAKKAKR